MSIPSVEHDVWRRGGVQKTFSQLDGMWMLIPIPAKPYWIFLSHESGFQVAGICQHLIKEVKCDQRKCLCQPQVWLLGNGQRIPGHGFLEDSFWVCNRQHCASCCLQGLTQLILTLTERSTSIPQRNERQLRNKNVTCVRGYINHGCALWESCSIESYLCLHFLSWMFQGIRSGKMKEGERERNWWMVYCWVIFLLNIFSFLCYNILTWKEISITLSSYWNGAAQVWGRQCHSCGPLWTKIEAALQGRGNRWHMIKTH